MFLRTLSARPRQRKSKRRVQALLGSDEDHAKLVANLQAYEAELDKKQAQWEATQGATAWTPLAPSEMKSAIGATFVAEPDGSILVQGNNDKDVYTITAATDLTGITGIRLEALTDARLPAQGPGRPDNGNFVLNEFRVTAAPKAEPAKAAQVMLQNASADFSQEGYAVAGAIDGNPATGWAVHPQTGSARHTVVFETTSDVNFCRRGRCCRPASTSSIWTASTSWASSA